MRIITEIELREQYKEQPFDTYILNHPDRLTPAAAQFLSERRITVTETGCKAGAKKVITPTANNTISGEEFKEGYQMGDNGRKIAEKPEEYTHLKGKVLVPKNHKRIKFRGKLDSFQAALILSIIEAECSGHKALAEDLGKILEYMRKMLRAEVLEESLEELNFNGWNGDELRERSHHPDRYFGVKHFMTGPQHGRLMALLNQLRTEVRELEIMGMEAFFLEEEKVLERRDIIQALNRLSSVIYIMMCQYLGRGELHGNV